MRWPFILAILLAAGEARADELRLISPNEIDYHEIEIEHEGAASQGGGRFYSADLGTGLTPWWHVGAEFDLEREAGPDNETSLQGITLENQIRLTRPGENWADMALYTEFTRSAERGIPDDMLVGAAFLKDIGHTTHTLDLYVDKSFGGDTEFTYAWQSRWNLYRQFAPSIEAFGGTRQLIAGPVATGAFLLGPLGKFRYEAGYLFGTVPTMRWKLELEIPI
jgi:hypothetical protein